MPSELYHAWISVYLDSVGWIDNIIYFDGKDWVRMDPTFAASGGGASGICGETAAIITTFIIIDPEDGTAAGGNFNRIPRRPRGKRVPRRGIRAFFRISFRNRDRLGRKSRG